MAVGGCEYGVYLHCHLDRKSHSASVKSGSLAGSSFFQLVEDSWGTWRGEVLSCGGRFVSAGNIVKSLRTAGEVWPGPQKKCGIVMYFSLLSLAPLPPSLV